MHFLAFLSPFPPLFSRSPRALSGHTSSLKHVFPALFQAIFLPSYIHFQRFFGSFFRLRTHKYYIILCIIYFISARKHFYRYLVRGAPYSPHNLSRLSSVNHVHPIIQSPYCLSAPLGTHPRLSSHCHAAATSAWPARTPTPVLPLSYGFRGPPTWHSTTACLPFCCLARDPF